MTKVIPINRQARAINALRPELHKAFVHAARNGFQSFIGHEATGNMNTDQAWQMFEWSREIGWNLRFNVNLDMLEMEVVVKEEIERNGGEDDLSLARRYAAFSETLRFLSAASSVAYPHLPKPKNEEQLTRLARQVCRAFYSVITAPLNGQLDPERSARAQDMALQAFGDARSRAT